MRLLPLLLLAPVFASAQNSLPTEFPADAVAVAQIGRAHV